MNRAEQLARAGQERVPTYIHSTGTRTDQPAPPPELREQLALLEIAAATLDMRRPPEELMANGTWSTLKSVAIQTDELWLDVAMRQEMGRLHKAVKAMHRVLRAYSDATDDNINAMVAALAQAREAREQQQEIYHLRTTLLRHTRRSQASAEAGETGASSTGGPELG